MLATILSPELIKSFKEIKELCAQKAQALAEMTPECREAIHRYARISMIGASTRIENAILTDSEISWMDTTLSKDGRPTAFASQKSLIENKLSKDKERSIEEVAGLRNVLGIVYHQAHELFPLSETTVRGLHRELLQYYSRAAHYLGKYKIAPNSVVERAGNTIVREVLKTSDPGPMTDVAMQELVQWYNVTLPNHLWSTAVVSEFVFRFLAIHPFQDGNGRLGRTLFLLGALQSPDEALTQVIPYLALDRHIEKHREEYYVVLRRCSGGQFLQDTKSYHMEHFIVFMTKMLRKALDHDISFYAEKYQARLDLSESAATVLACFREHPEQRLYGKDLMAQLAMPRRTLNYVLGQLVEGHFLQRYGKGPATRYQLVF